MPPRILTNWWRCPPKAKNDNRLKTPAMGTWRAAVGIIERLYFMDFDGKSITKRPYLSLKGRRKHCLQCGEKKEALPKLMALPARPALCGGMLPLIVYAKVMTIVKKNLPTTRPHGDPTSAISSEDNLKEEYHFDGR